MSTHFINFSFYLFTLDSDIKNANILQCSNNNSGSRVFTVCACTTFPYNATCDILTYCTLYGLVESLIINYYIVLSERLQFKLLRSQFRPLAAG